MACQVRCHQRHRARRALPPPSPTVAPCSRFPGGFMSIPQPLRAAVLTLALLAPLPRAAPAQEPTHVVGQVRGSSSQLPIPGVRVAVVGTAVGTVTDATGHYALDV